jgi:hypothetical protein
MKLHSFNLAPCLIHTPPLIAPLLHPLGCVHRLTVAPCVIHTPPFTAHLVQFVCEQFLTLAPCATHSPPWTAHLLQPSGWAQVLMVDVPHPVHIPDSMGQFLVHVLEVHTLTMVDEE